jgi:ATP-dependent RNA helicase DeaD
MYRKLFTKNTPFFSRSTLAAYFLKLLLEKNGGLSPRPAARRTQPQTDMRMLFFGLGKNRKVFPRDISGLILGKFPEMDKSDIGEIRILDSYSFVEVTESRAQAVIDGLNGSEYRGKTLAVNYARKKEEAQ